MKLETELVSMEQLSTLQTHARGGPTLSISATNDAGELNSHMQKNKTRSASLTLRKNQLKMGQMPETCSTARGKHRQSTYRQKQKHHAKDADSTENDPKSWQTVKASVQEGEKSAE